jgi:nicotinamide-nucleotide amidase
MITDLSGSSDYFTLGVVAYAQEQKQRILGVSKETLNRFSAVSRETCAEMLAGIKRLSGADLCIATTGYAGPTGGTPADPVGTVYVGVSVGEIVSIERMTLDGTRTEIKSKAAVAAIYAALCQLTA